MESSTTVQQPPQQRLRIAVLECDTPLESTRARYGGGYGAVFRALLDAAVESMRDNKHGDSTTTTTSPPPPELDVTAWDIVNKSRYPRVEDIDAVLITGSRYCAFDDDPWIVRLVDFVKGILTSSSSSSSSTAGHDSPHVVRVIGVCFGHQIVGRALGAPVVRSDAGWEIAVLPMYLTERGKEIFGRSELNIHQMHRDIVPSLPPTTTTISTTSSDIESLGSSPRCHLQGMYRGPPATPFLTIQGHPEFTRDIVREIAELRHRDGIFDHDTYTDAMRRVDLPHDGIVVARAMVRFLLDDR